MIEKEKAEIYLGYLDKILAGKDVESIKDEEIRKLLILSKTIIDSDLSDKCEIKEKLKIRLLARIKELELAIENGNEYELNDEDLTHVSAGFTEQGCIKNNICPYCGSRLKEPGGECPVCHH